MGFGAFFLTLRLSQTPRIGGVRRFQKQRDIGSAPYGMPERSRLKHNDRPARRIGNCDVLRAALGCCR